MMLRSILITITLTIAIAADCRAQEYAGGAPAPAKYEVRTSAGFPMGLGVSGGIRLLPVLSIEGGIGVLPVALAESEALNIHVAPSRELDPAITLMHSCLVQKGDNADVLSLMFGYLQSRKTGLHTYLRGGVSGLYVNKRLYPALALEFGLTYGLR